MPYSKTAGMSVLAECRWREMALYLTHSFINIMPALWCSEGWRPQVLFVMQEREREIKALDLGTRLLPDHGSMSQTEGQIRTE